MKTQNMPSTKDGFVELVKELREKLKAKDNKILELESDLKIQQDREQQHRQEDLNTIYACMGETVRMRRLLEITGEDRDRYMKRAENAERGVRNLKKWLEISGEKGEPDD